MRNDSPAEGTTVPPVLYKYLRPERIDVIHNKKIRFTQPTATNDLFELRPLFDSLIPAEQFDALMRPTDAMLEVAFRKQYDALPPKQKASLSFNRLMSLVRSHPGLIDASLRSLMPQLKAFAHDFVPRLQQMMTDGFGRMIGILSLTETPKNQAMWAHYADDHHGFILAFNTASPFFNRRRSEKDEFHHLRRVTYFDRKAAGVSLIDLSGNDIFFTKATEWSYEREWRMIAPLGTDLNNPPSVDEVVLFAYPAPALQQVIIGTRAEGTLRDAVSRLIAKDPTLAHVQLFQAYASGLGSTLEIKRVFN